MAYVSGTAVSHTALFDALITFLTSDATLSAATQNWTVSWTHTGGQQSGIVLKGPGLAEQDEVYVGLRLWSDADSDQYWIELAGMTGVIPTATDYRGHINPSPYYRMFVDSGTQSYWFVASGRRFIVVNKISTIFESAYAGLMLPYATPFTYPYPLFVGGAAGTVSTYAPMSWRSVDAAHRCFVSPYYTAGDNFYSRAAGAGMLDPAGQWLAVASAQSGGQVAQVGVAPEESMGQWGYNFEWTGEYIRSRQMTCFGGDYAVWPVTLVQALPTDQTFGVLDGAFRCQGIANAAENLITVGSTNYLVVQNAFRTGIGEYWALRLE